MGRRMRQANMVGGRVQRGIATFQSLWVHAMNPLDAIEQALIASYCRRSGLRTGQVVMVSGEYQAVCDFTTTTTADAFGHSWTQASTGLAKVSVGTVNIDGSGGRIIMTGMAEARSYGDPVMAVAAATGVSSGSAWLMHALWSGRMRSVFPFDVVSVNQGIAGQVVSGQMRHGSRIRLVIKDGLLIRLHRERAPTSQHQQPLSHAESRKMQELLRVPGNKRLCPTEMRRARLIDSMMSDTVIG
jgi:hypothetical protein